MQKIILVKRIISISLIAISTLVLLLFIILPHHHEGGVCIIMEYCEQDNAINDEHTHHSGATNGRHSESCIAESDFILPYFNDEIKCKVFSCKGYNHNHIYLFSVYFLVADFFNFDIDDSFTGIGYGEYISFHKSAEANQFHGLRAPPITLS
jgi:hypothetical protein